MTETVVQKLVYRGELDMRDATREADKWEKRLERVTSRQLEVAAAERETEARAAELRRELLRLGRAELDSAADKKKLAAEGRAVRQSLREQAEATRGLRHEQAALRREEQALTAERTRSIRTAHQQAAVMKRSSSRIAADVRAATSARGRSSRADVRLRGVYQRQGAAGGRIEALQASLEELDVELAGLNSTPNARLRRGLASPFGGGASPYKKRRGGGYEDDKGRHVSFDEVIAEAAGRRGKQAIAGLPGFAVGAGQLAAGGVGATAGAVGAIARTGSEFETLRTGLGTALGSDAAGEKAFEQVRQFAKETPFAVKEVVQAVTALKVRGLEPTVDAAMEALRTYGDVAGALGQSLPDVINAVTSASVGEFEELKQKFNVIGHKAGDEIKFTFAGVTTTVKNDSKAIVEYLKNLGKTNFAGGMERQAKTLGGVWSNLSDAVAIFAEDVYRSGLGDALKDVLKDITGNVEGADGLAKTIGETLAGAVRDGYAWLKEFVGPLDELPEKFAEAFRVGQQFVGVVGTLIKAGTELAGVLDVDGAALLALTLAAGAALGPMGALAAASLAVGYAIGAALDEGESHLESIQRRVGDIRREVDKAEIDRLKKETNAQQEELEAGQKRIAAREKAADRVMRAELRALGVTTSAEAAALPEAEKQRISRLGAQVRAKGQGLGGAEDDAASAEAFASGREGLADRAEYNRLQRLPKNKRSKMVEKRLAELADKLDVRKATAGAAPKPTLSAFETEQKSIIDKQSKEAGLRAADAALLSGRGAEAAALSSRAEKETRERLKGAASRGEALPGEVDTAFGRIAGYDSVGGQPPPPVIVNNYKVDVHVPAITVHGTDFGGDPRGAGESIAASLIDHLEHDVFPRVAQVLQPGFTR